MPTPNNGCGGCCDFVGRLLDDIRTSDGTRNDATTTTASLYTPSLALSNGIPIISWTPTTTTGGEGEQAITTNTDLNNTFLSSSATSASTSYRPRPTRLVSTTATPTIDMDHIAYSGYLYKQSKHLKRFRRRYCILIIDKLYTFKQVEDVTRGLVTEVLDLALADYLVEWDITPRVPNYNVIAGKYSFEIGTEAETPTRREWMFAADTEHERHEWIHHIGSYCRHVWRPPGSGLEGRIRLFSTINNRQLKNNKKELPIPCGRTVTMPPKQTINNNGMKLNNNEEEEDQLTTTPPAAADDDNNVMVDVFDDDVGIVGIVDESSIVDYDCIFTNCCCICLKEFNDEEVWQLCCGHYFCIICIQNWSRYKRTCPVCRDVF